MSIVTNGLEVVRYNKRGESRTGTIRNLTMVEINRIVGQPLSKERSGDGKVTCEWSFRVTGRPGYFGIWDYKGSSKYKEWSTYGNSDTLILLFGANYTAG